MSLVIFMIVVGLIVFVALVARGSRTTSHGGHFRFRKTTSAALQRFLPLQAFHASGAMIVSGRFRQMIRVGDINLYSMTLEDIVVMRDRFRELVKHLDHPFQISVQARRANYTDFVRYSEDVVKRTVREYDNSAFSVYAHALAHYLREEAAKPRTDRENLIVVGVLPTMTGEDELGQLERLAREQGFVETGLQQMELPYQVLDPIDCVEAIQNFYNRERAMSQRYRDAFHRKTHAPQVDGQEVEADDVAMAKEA